jgi:cyclohexa-1,5-dienecarbonyl-CoA hydratase
MSQSVATKAVTTNRLNEGQVLSLTLDAPKANILDTKMVLELIAAVEEAAADDGLKAIVIEGAGKHFSFGASVEEHAAEKVGEMLPTFHALFRALSRAAIPTVAVVRGQCLGGGMELASYCSWIFAGEGAAFGQPEIKLAVFPPVASVILPWRLGGGRALDLCVSGRSITAQHARDIGLVHSVSADPGETARAFIAEHVLSKSATALRFAERAARHGLSLALDSHLRAIEALYLDELMKTPDANEGIAAFIERRPPNYAQSERRST